MSVSQSPSPFPPLTSSPDLSTTSSPPSPATAPGPSSLPPSTDPTPSPPSWPELRSTSTTSGSSQLHSLDRLWLVIYFFKEDPLVGWGYHFSDWAVLVGLVLGSFAVMWMTNGLGSVVLGLGVGLLGCGLHGLVRNFESLFLNENDSVSARLIGPTYTPV